MTTANTMTCICGTTHTFAESEFMGDCAKCGLVLWRTGETVERFEIDPWDVLRRLRARALVDATTRDDDIGGADAVIELCEIREELDDALRYAPRRAKS